MKIKGLNLFRLSVYLFFILFLCVGLSCKPKVIDLRVKGGSQEEINPSDTNPAEPIVPIDPKPIPIDPEEPTPIDPEEQVLSNKKYIKLVSGGFHNCAITVNKHVVCWGSSAYGQVGANEFKHDSPARLVKDDEGSLLSDVIDIVSGNYHSCALLKDETVKCWGYNRNHNLGNGNDITNKYYAVDVLTEYETKLTDVKSIVSRGQNTCAIIGNNREVRCWGINTSGQLGNNNKTVQSYAVYVKNDDGISNLEDVLKVVVGEYHSCAVLNNKSIKCWGGNTSGQLGMGDTSEHLTAVEVVGVTNVKDISLGRNHSCVVLNGGGVKCWGDNDYGQLGNGDTEDKSTAVDVAVITNAKEISLGANHSCVILDNEDKTIKCWGRNNYGQLGNGTNTNSSNPVDVEIDSEHNLLTNVKKIFLALDEGCAILDNEGKAIKCWGYNSTGLLGNGTDTNSVYASFVKISEDQNLKKVKDIDIGKIMNYYACALLEDKSIKCFGTNTAYALGYGYSSYTDDFIEIKELSNKGISKIIQIGSSSYISYCALLSSEGTVKCWGENSLGQLGNGTLENILEPSYVKKDETHILTEVKDIFLGGTNEDGYACAIVGENRTLKCWGNNTHGQLGNCSNTDSRYPVEVKESGCGSNYLTHVQDDGVFLYQTHACAITGVNRELKCWGENNDYQLGDGTSENKNYAVNVRTDEPANLEHVVKFMGSSGISCAITGESEETQELRCWGEDEFDSIGNGSKSSNVAVNVIDKASQRLTYVKDVVSSTTDFKCAIIGQENEEYNIVKCWGNNSEGKLGDGSQTSRDVADTVKISAGVNLTDVKKILIASHACAITGNNNELKCWGYGSYGQIGNKINSSALYATNVLNENNSLLSHVSDFKIIDDTTCAIITEENDEYNIVKCWGKGDGGLLVNASYINYAKKILNEDGTTLSNVKGINIEHSRGYALLNDNTLKHWGDIDNSVIYLIGGSSILADMLDRKKTAARSILSRTTLEPMTVSSERIPSPFIPYILTHSEPGVVPSESMLVDSSNIMFVSNDDKFYFRGLSSVLGNLTSVKSYFAKPIDSSLVEEE